MLLRFCGCLELLSEPLSLAGGDGGDVGDACPEEDCTLSVCPRGLPLTAAGMARECADQSGSVAVRSWQDGPHDHADVQFLGLTTGVRRQRPKPAEAG